MSKSIRSVLEDLETRCPRCYGEGHGGDGCTYCWDNDVKKLAVDQALKDIAQIIDDNYSTDPDCFKSNLREALL